MTACSAAWRQAQSPRVASDVTRSGSMDRRAAVLRFIVSTNGYAHVFPAGLPAVVVGDHGDGRVANLRLFAPALPPERPSCR